MLTYKQSGIRDPEQFRARLKGIAVGTATKNTTTTFYYQFTQQSWLSVNKQGYFDGVQYYAQDAVVGDYITFSVVDKDGLVYPAGTVLDGFAETFYIVPNSKTEIRLFKAKTIPGMYIKIDYVSTGTSTDVQFLCNLFRFLKGDENT